MKVVRGAPIDRYAPLRYEVALPGKEDGPSHQGTWHTLFEL